MTGADLNILAREENGYWSTDVPGAKAGDEYRYMIHTPLIGSFLLSLALTLMPKR